METIWFIFVFASIFFAAITEHKQSRQFEKLGEEMRNVPQEACMCHLFFLFVFVLVFAPLNVRFWLQIIRGGRRVSVCSSDIVVGDIVPLKNGFQVCIFIFDTFVFLSFTLNKSFLNCGLQ